MRRIGAVLVLALALTGCGGDKTLDHARLVQRIGAWADKNGVPGAKVDCPDDVTIKAGRTFHCLVSKGGQTVRLTVTIENSDGYVTWEAS